MVQELRTPNMRSGFYTLLINRDSSEYQAQWPIRRGTPYASILGADSRIITQYAANPLYLLKEIRPGNSSASDFGTIDQWVIWVFATDELAESTFNAAIVYENESTTTPGFTRVYDVRRKTYEANPTLAYGSSLTALLSVNITAPGTGYTFATGTIATGATVEFVCFGGQLIDAIVTNEGTGVASGGSLTITGDGTGATATARIQPATAVLVSQRKEEFPSDNPRSHDYVQVIRVYETLPSTILTTNIRSAEVRGRNVDVTVQKGLNGTLAPETGNLIISSKTHDLTDVVEERTTMKVASLPPDQVTEFWDYVPLPTLLFTITPGWFCNNSEFFTVVTNFETGGGASALRKHKKTVTYHNSDPSPNLSGSTFEVVDIRYQGKVISFAFSNVLNDAISFDQDFYNSSSGAACFWTEAYDYSASSPSATTFAAGAWYVRSFTLEDWGDSGYKATKIEFYSAPGDP